MHVSSSSCTQSSIVHTNIQDLDIMSHSLVISQSLYYVLLTTTSVYVKLFRKPIMYCVASSFIFLAVIKNTVSLTHLTIAAYITPRDELVDKEFV